ncbi:B-box zinc finger protein 24-like [Impatiens glandulifera]|uniref:B-box zinc finger protein 24-like n=1 Tax=Impatiens glandulifera TaxID=253017 RepID=UPI001FB170F6|nr:B-box zinc finger protein 24-like [Impatiens glandulifera]
MKIQCDVCEKAPATVICCADEAALCSKCDFEVHAANKLASKHQRLLLQCLSTKLPTCDICQEKPAFIFCVEDRALFCQDCDEPIHSANKHAADHQRFLATGIRVALGSRSNNNNNNDAPPPNSITSSSSKPSHPPTQQQPVSPWGVDDLLRFSDFESSDKKEHLEFGELEWLLADDHVAAAEVPQLNNNYAANSSYRQTKSNVPPYKKARIEIQQDDDDEYFTVPDLG